MTHQVEGGAEGGTTSPPVTGDPLAVDDWNRIGRISRVQVYPLKSATAPPAGAVALDRNGAVGDRWFLVTDLAGEPVTAQDAPELREVVALLAMDGGLVLHVPGAPATVRGDRADEALSELLGRQVRIVPAARSASRLDAPVHLVSVQALDAAQRGEHGAADCACSLEEPRANLLVDLAGLPGDPAADGRAEAVLVGRRLRIGSAELEVTRTRTTAWAPTPTCWCRAPSAPVTPSSCSARSRSPCRRPRPIRPRWLRRSPRGRRSRRSPRCRSSPPGTTS